MDYSIRLFVYDNLRKNEKKHHLLKGAEPLNMQSWTTGELKDTEDGFPVLMNNKADRVYGEVYQISKKQLHDLDQYLTDNSFNGKMEKKQIHTDQGKTEAYTAIFNIEDKELKRVEYGDWKCHTKLESEEFLYFAYGSCMDDERMIKAGVDDLFQHVEGCGILRGYSLGYTIKANDGAGRADIIETGKNSVEGKVYRVNKEAMTYLFTREGVHGNRYRPAFVDLQLNGRRRKDVLTFIVMEKCEEIAPPEHYALEIIRGAEGLVSDEYHQKLQSNLLNKFQMSVPIN